MHPPTPDPADEIKQHAVSQVAIVDETRVGDSPESDQGAPPPVPEDELLPGTLVGEYRIVRRIGEGGMGVVFEAVHPLIGRKVAIKVLNAVGGASAGAGARFLLEARTASMVRHRNIVDVFAFGELHDGRLYLVMEFLEGETLGTFLGLHGPLSFAAAMSIFEGVLAGLHVAHGKGVVHRDLKPDNIWLLPADEPGDDEPEMVDPLRVKVLDFGIAKITAGDGAGVKLTRAGAPIGTPAFMSPEQCRGDAAIDARSDIYALGVMLYEMFTMRVPFSGDTFIEILHQHLNSPPPPLESGMPEELQEVIERALAKSPGERFQTVAELREALLACRSALDWSPRPAGHGQVAASVEVAAAARRRGCRRHFRSREHCRRWCWERSRSTRASTAMRCWSPCAASSTTDPRWARWPGTSAICSRPRASTWRGW